MWSSIADSIIRLRFPLMGLIALITVVMGYHASKVEMSYDFNRTVPIDDPDMVFLNKVKAQFGEDGNLVAIGLRDSSVYKKENFEKLLHLSKNLRKVEGVNEVLSLPLLKIILKEKSKMHKLVLI